MAENSFLSASDRDLLEPHFDEKFYLAAYPEVSALDLTPMDHYHLHGWREGRNPNARFNTTYYLKRYPDIAAAGMNPLLHYARTGIFEGREPIRRLDAWRTRLESLHAASPGKFRVLQGELIPSDALYQVLRERLEGATLVLSVSHDDYVLNIGGIQNVIHDEEKAAVARGWHYLHVAPAIHVTRLAERSRADTFEIGLRLNGEFVGPTTIADLSNVVAKLRPDLKRVEVVVHHLMSHAPELIADLIKSVDCPKPVVWAHDFFASCPSYTLLRNDVVFCGGPPLGSSACDVCRYGVEREDHLKRISMFFRATPPVLMAPSSSAVENLQKSISHAVSAKRVTPPARLLLSQSKQRRSAGNGDSPLKIAHLGGRHFHKGWPVFEDLALKHKGDPRYQFFQLGHADGVPLPQCIQHVSVQVTRESRHEMVEAVARHEIDIAVIWSLWPETFCFTANEALAGGAFLLTNKIAGNVAALVEQWPDAGMVFDDATDLFSAFEGHELASRTARSQRMRGAVVLSSDTIEFFLTQKSDHAEHSLISAGGTTGA